MNPLSLHVVVEHGEDLRPYGCAYIRDLLPLGHPANQWSFRVTHGLDVQEAEIVVVERTWKPAVTLCDADHLVARIRRQGSCFVYSLDDNLLDLELLPQETRAVLRMFCREADGIVVATPALAARVAKLNRCVRLVPNAIDERLHFTGEPNRPEQHSDRLVLGYMGTLTHDRDLMMVLQPLREILRMWPEPVELQIVGALADRRLMLAFKGLPATLLEVPGPDVAYPRFVRWMHRNLRWDVGLAPLEDTPFNRYKSDIKFLDYAALGVPGLYSRVPAYGGTVEHLRTGLLVGETPAEWAAALTTLLGDAGLRRSLAVAAAAQVRSQRSLVACAGSWREAILAIAAGRHTS